MDGNFINWEAEYAYQASDGQVTEPINGNYLCALAIHFGYTKPINGSWLQTICNHFGVVEPINGSWYQALAHYYDYDLPQYNASWRYTLAFHKIPFEAWDFVEEEWQSIDDIWNDI